VIWYTSQFYAQTFILTKCNVEYEQANTMILIALVIARRFLWPLAAVGQMGAEKHYTHRYAAGHFIVPLSFGMLYDTADVSKRRSLPTRQRSPTKPNW